VDFRTAKKLPNRLPKYPVPERLRKCVAEDKDVTVYVPSLLEVRLSFFVFLARSACLSTKGLYILRGA